MKTDEVHESCREWVDDKWGRCDAPADVILWGKLFDPEALGPRCAYHATRWLMGDTINSALSRGWAIFDLRDLRRVR